MKVIGLIPAVMTRSTRTQIRHAFAKTIAELKLDAYVVYDQGFIDQDRVAGVTYIGHQSTAVPRHEALNALLNYFYDSDADYAFWLDATSTVSHTTVNDLATILQFLQPGEINNCDAIFSTLGQWVSTERIQYKSSWDYMSNVHLVPIADNKSYNWMSGLLQKNFYKYYGQRFLVDVRCASAKGTPEDVYFARLLRKLANCYLAPTLVVSSAHVGDIGVPVLYNVLDQYKHENIISENYSHVNPNAYRRELILTRVSYEKSSLTQYKPRDGTSNKVSLF